MNTPGVWRHMLMALVTTLVLVSCDRPIPNLLQGYVEGEYLYLSSPLSGRLVKLAVQRGSTVQEGDLLFELEGTVTRAVLEEARQRLLQARANLSDSRKGRRPTELAAIRAQLKQAREAWQLAAKELARQESLHASGAIALDAVDRARSTQEQGGQRVAQLEAEVGTAELGQRGDQIAAVEAEVLAREAAVAKAEWEMSQTVQKAPQSGMVHDTLYREGEWIVAGRPVVAVLPPDGVKVRVFVPEPRLGRLHVGDVLRVRVDGVAGALAGRVRFISTQAEFTPPVIYSRENRSKLVYLVELQFDPTVAAGLHPGQPVDVEFGP